MKSGRGGLYKIHVLKDKKHKPHRLMDDFFIPKLSDKKMTKYSP